jgi:hypothetical protein
MRQKEAAMTHPDAISTMLASHCDAEQIAGAEALVWQDDRILHHSATGWRDREALKVMERQAIFRIA